MKSEIHAGGVSSTHSICCIDLRKKKDYFEREPVHNLGNTVLRYFLIIHRHNLRNGVVSFTSNNLIKIWQVDSALTRQKLNGLRVQKNKTF